MLFPCVHMAMNSSIPSLPAVSSPPSPPPLPPGLFLSSSKTSRRMTSESHLTSLPCSPPTARRSSVHYSRGTPVGVPRGSSYTCVAARLAVHCCDGEALPALVRWVTCSTGCHPPTGLVTPAGCSMSPCKVDRGSGHQEVPGWHTHDPWPFPLSRSLMLIYLVFLTSSSFVSSSASFPSPSPSVERLSFEEFFHHPFLAGSHAGARAGAGTDTMEG